MKTLPLHRIPWMLALATLACQPAPRETSVEQSAAFDPTWESLAAIEKQPEWFKDAKLGIYFHWGVYSVPAYGSEWYPRWMYVPDRGENSWGPDIYAYHAATYGGVDKVNYHDFIPDFTASQFDPEEWAALFETAGAKFAGPVAQHHDGFAMWASQVNPWNAKDKGPKRDITGELFGSLKARNMKTIATFHHAKLGQKYQTDTANWAGNGPQAGRHSHYPYHPDYITSTTDPELRLLYGNMDTDAFNDYWLAQIKEVVDQYAPDILWYDSWLDQIPEQHKLDMMAHHFNAGIAKGQEPMVIHKQEDLPDSISVLDIEQGGKTGLSEDYWMTDITISYRSWSYIQGHTYKTPDLVVRNMIDVWSKRGVVLLNISPTADGEIPEAQRSVLRGIGAWIDLHEEAIYGTRAHHIHGYGDAAFEKGHFGGQSATIDYSQSDIRFTKAKDGNILYVFTLGMPAPDAQLTIKEVRGPDNAPDMASVSVLGSNTEVSWSFEDELLTINTPQASLMDSIATVFEVEFE